MAHIYIYRKVIGRNPTLPWLYLLLAQEYQLHLEALDLLFCPERNEGC